MGKTYKSQTDFDYLDDTFDDMGDFESDYDDDMDLYLEHSLSGSAKRGKGKRGRRKGNDLFGDSEHHRLPRDWQDFDYGADFQSTDDWR